MLKTRRAQIGRSPRCRVLLGWALGGVVLALAPIAHAGEAGAPASVNYRRPFEPSTRPALLALPPGAIEPDGWLRDWCLAARDGFTGHMDEYDDEFKRAWAPDHKMTGEGLLWYKGAWPYEGGGYWFDGLARLGFALHDETLIALAKNRLYAVADNMNSDGLLFLWWLDRKNPDDRKAVTAALEGWPLWACGLLGRAMTGFYAGSGDKHVLDALEQAYAPDPDCLRWITGNMSNPWPAYDTYCWTGNQGIAAALDAMFQQQGGALLPNLNRYRDPPDLNPGATVANAHVVEFLESTTPWAVGYLWTGDRRYLEAAVGWHELLDRVSMQPHGVPVSDEWYGPTGAFRGSETCDVAGYVWSQISLLLVTGEGRMADRAERAFFNAGPATVSRDFKTHVYFQSPNRFANLSPDFPHGPRASGGTYQRKHSPLCCTAALNRIVPWYVTHMWMGTCDNGLAATCYGPCKVTALVADRVPIVITCKTDYPFNEATEISVQPAREAAFPLDFRIPGWCTAPRLEVNGSVVAAEWRKRGQESFVRSTRRAGSRQMTPDPFFSNGPSGFARIHRTWKPGDSVRLTLPMTACLQTGRDASSGAPYDGAHRATLVTIPEKNSTRGVQYATVSYGPLLFALPIPDTLDANTPDRSTQWKFALDVQDPNLTIERTAMPARWDWPLAAPLKLRTNAVAVAWNPDPLAPRLPLLPAAKQNPPQQVTLIPYGCTKFRISMFPVTAEPEVKPSAIRRILFLGNSITLHGPNPGIGWTGNWGMAASSQDKDYVHLVTGALARHCGATPEIMVRNIADFERNYATYDVDLQLKDCFAFEPDLVVLAIGENVSALDSEDAKSQFKAGVMNILRCTLAGRRPLVVVRSCFWTNAAKDQVLSQACQEAGGIFVNIGPLGQDAANAARSERSFTHDGVAGHPGDKGMQAIANAIVKAVLSHQAAGIGGTRK
ncbi:MAG: glycoside hydrolase family 127 protein [Planctomycetes bacterium]|nr:glycoside hydrolase family 127 protein [Planctomycetota bacterium]MBL7039999.1 glycoside hydrolase family 127 protein [Pirellulaceae bacterium]